MGMVGLPGSRRFCHTPIRESSRRAFLSRQLKPVVTDEEDVASLIARDQDSISFSLLNVAY
jgi:hypothetical protein